MMLGNISAHLLHKRILIGHRELVFGNIAGEQRGLRRQQEQRLHQRLLFGRDVEGDRVFPY